MNAPAASQKSHSEDANQWRLGVLLASFLGVLIFGFWGFYVRDSSMSISSLLYLTIQLFSMNSGAVPGSVPWQLELARWLAPLSLGGGVLLLAHSFVAGCLLRLRIRNLRNHDVVCGLGGLGVSLANDLLSHRRKVLALDPSPQAEDLRIFLKNGGLHLPISVNSSEDLAAAGISAAASLVMATPDDSRNLAVALQVEQALAGRGRRTNQHLRVFTHIGSIAYRDLLDRNSFLGATPHGKLFIRSFNVYANQARLLMQAYPLETAGWSDGAVNPTRKVRLILPALSPDATALALHAARVGHYLGRRKVHLHVVSAHASEEFAALKTCYPCLEKCFDSLLVEPCQEDRFSFATQVARIVHAHPEDCCTVYPSFDSNPSALAAILRMHELLDVHAKVRMPLPDSLRDLIGPVAEKRASLAERIAWFPESRQSCGMESIFSEKLDDVARKIHDIWYQENSRQISEASAKGEHQLVEKLASKPAYKSWDTLTEEQKDSNRYRADHLEIKVRAGGFSPNSLTNDAWRKWCHAHPDRLEQLASAEHDRWMATQLIAGWVHAETRDDSQKKHDDLVPYESLNDATKQYDRDACVEDVKYLLST